IPRPIVVLPDHLLDPAGSTASGSRKRLLLWRSWFFRSENCVQVRQQWSRRERDTQSYEPGVTKDNVDKIFFKRYILLAWILVFSKRSLQWSKRDRLPKRRDDSI